jgi:hypothetical protein
LGDGFVVSERHRLGSNPAAADTDGDGLTDLAEVTGWQFVYAPGKVTWVTSDPAKRDSDGDGLSDKIERDLHASDPTRFPFHPRVPNEAAFIGLDYQFDAGTFYQGKPFIGSQTAAYTTTLVNQLTPVYALSGALSLSLPPALQLTGGAATNPFYLAGGETQANSFGLAAAAGAASGPVALTNQIFFQLDERGLAGWRWGLLQPNINSAAGGDYPWFSAVAPATGWSAPLLLASIEGAKVTSGTLFDTARVRVYGLNNGALGPPLTVDDDLHPDKWVDAPDIACNSAGRCLVVWSEPAANIWPSGSNSSQAAARMSWPAYWTSTARRALNLSRLAIPLTRMMNTPRQPLIPTPARRLLSTAFPATESMPGPLIPPRPP